MITNMTSTIQGGVAQHPTVGQPPAALPAPVGQPVDAAPDPEAERDYVDEMQREVALEEGRDPDAQIDDDEPIPDDAVAVPIGGKLIHVMPQGQWRSSALAAVNRGDFDSWAEECVYDADVWFDLDPKLDDIQDMFADMREISGQDQGKSRAARRFSRRGRRR